MRTQIPLWSAIPFLGVVLSVAVFPTFFPGFWRRYNILILATFAIPVLFLSAAIDPTWVTRAFTDYVSFVCLMGALFSIGGGLYVSGTAKANPITNLGYLALGAVFANLLGTLGASMILVRPLLRSNRGRKHEAHVFIFFIFVVANAGILTPVSNPPLLMGYLMGVPFFWSLKLFPVWLFLITSLLGIFVAVDSYFYLNDPDFRGPLKAESKQKLHITGRWNLALIPVLLFGLLIPQLIPNHLEIWREAFQISLLVAVTYVSRLLTPKLISSLNEFSWEPLKEVAVIFAGIFATMIPALKLLEANELSLGLTTTSAFFWISGIVSSLLDNAPAYAAFFAAAKGLGRDATMISLSNGQTISEPLLFALTGGTVFFGALTYIGNVPNLLIKSIVEESGVKMPSFFSYLIWSIGFLLPVLFLTGIIFFEH